MRWIRILRCLWLGHAGDKNVNYPLNDDGRFCIERCLRCGRRDVLGDYMGHW